MSESIVILLHCLILLLLNTMKVLEQSCAAKDEYAQQTLMYQFVMGL